MKLVSEEEVKQTIAPNMKFGEIGIITTGCYTGKIVRKMEHGYLCLNDFLIYELNREMNVRVYQKGTKLTFEV